MIRPMRTAGTAELRKSTVAVQQDDVVGIFDNSGNEVVSYRYDAWGQPLNVTGSLATTLGVYNPFRYHGYVYDEETGLYDLRSR